MILFSKMADICSLKLLWIQASHHTLEKLVTDIQDTVNKLWINDMIINLSDDQVLERVPRVSGTLGEVL